MLPPICLRILFFGDFGVTLHNSSHYSFFAGKQLKRAESFMAQINKNHNPASIADSLDDQILCWRGSIFLLLPVFPVIYFLLGWALDTVMIVLILIERS